MKRQYILEEWNSFALKVLHPQTPTLQRVEMRRAFYAGAWSILTAVNCAITPGPGEPTEADIAVLIDIQHEMMTFNEKVKRGEA